MKSIGSVFVSFLTAGKNQDNHKKSVGSKNGPLKAARAHQTPAFGLSPFFSINTLNAHHPSNKKIPAKIWFALRFRLLAKI